MTRFEECRAHVLRHADGLIQRIKVGKLNAGRFEILMETYLDQPGFDRTFRRALLDCALTRFDGHER